MKNLFTILLLFLAVASLGLAFPQPNHTPKLPESKTSTPALKTSTPALKTSTPAPEPAPATIAPPPAPTTPATTTPGSITPGSITPEGIDAALGGISKQCGAAILTIVTSPEFLKCVPVTAFLPIVPIVTDPTFLVKLKQDPAGTFKKIEPPFVQFSKAFCVAPKCSDDGIAGAIKTLSDGCKDDLKSNPVIQLLFDAVVFYSPLHDTVCFKDKKTNKFCWDESLTTVFSLPKSPIRIIDGGLIDSIAVADPDQVCTNCNKDIINTFGNFLQGNKLALQILAQLKITQKELDLVKVGIAVKCGIKFEDGKIPDKP